MKNVCFGFLFMANFCNFTVLYNDLKISEEHREPLEIVANRVAGPHFLSVCSSSSKKFSFIQLMEVVNCEDCPVAEFIYHIYHKRPSEFLLWPPPDLFEAQMSSHFADYPIKWLRDARAFATTVLIPLPPLVLDSCLTIK